MKSLVPYPTRAVNRSFFEGTNWVGFADECFYALLDELHAQE
ncbi:hypothetical protein [Candidatus Steffania adelgidicola]|nr:hypothetical protein [Candidatus Steffania adelgidicola]